MQEVIGNSDFLQIVDKLKGVEPFPHTLIHGPSGSGKTTLGRHIAEVTGKEVLSLYGPELSKFTLIMLIQAIQEYDVLMVDEIHGMKNILLDMLYQPMEEFTFQSQDIPPFTLIGITTELSDLPDALQRRFRINYRVDLYSNEELMVILNSLRSKDVEYEAIERVADISRGSPGFARNHLQIIESMFGNENEIIEDHVMEYQRLKHINDIGLEDIDIKYLIALFQFGHLSLSTMSSILLEREKTIDNTIEPYLFRLGFVVKTSQGRTLTPKGKNYTAKLLGSK